MRKENSYWLSYFQNEIKNANEWRKKRERWESRGGELVSIKVRGRKQRSIHYDAYTKETYFFYITCLINHHEQYHHEEIGLSRELISKDGKIVNNKEADYSLKEVLFNGKKDATSPVEGIRGNRYYDRREAVRYAERWWNDYNPNFHRFSNDCTNYISQCLYAGGSPMRGAPNREEGWWYTGDNWSFSWSVAHSLRWYLSSSNEGLRGREVSSPEELMIGDVICYDFQGDGRWDHTTIVVRHDAEGMPLVNAHTDNSRNRYWSYEDSSAWTPQIQYKFFHIE